MPGICQDIMYKPVILWPCGDSFCGACVSDWLNRQYGSESRTFSLARGRRRQPCIRLVLLILSQAVEQEDVPTVPHQDRVRQGRPSAGQHH